MLVADALERVTGSYPKPSSIWSENCASAFRVDVMETEHNSLLLRRKIVNSCFFLGTPICTRTHVWLHKQHTPANVPAA